MSILHWKVPGISDKNSVQLFYVTIYTKQRYFETKLVNTYILVNVKVVETKLRSEFILFSKAIIPAVQVWVPAMSRQFLWVLQVWGLLCLNPVPASKALGHQMKKKTTSYKEVRLETVDCNRKIYWGAYFWWRKRVSLVQVPRDCFCLQCKHIEFKVYMQNYSSCLYYLYPQGNTFYCKCVTPLQRRLATQSRGVFFLVQSTKKIIIKILTQ